MHIFLSAGEASGDKYAARLVQGIKKEKLAINISGIGSSQLKNQEISLIGDCSEWGVIGISQALRVYPKIRSSFYTAKKYLKQNPGGLFIPIDYGYMNVRLAKVAKKNNWKVLYFVPPGSWKRNVIGKDLPQITDAIVTPFEWNQKLLSQAGANAHWFGHPLKQLLRESALPKNSREGIAILPGSRTHEVAHNLPTIFEATKNLDLPLKFGVAPNFNLEEMKVRWEKLGGREAEFKTGTQEVLLNSKAGIICSGTATLEAALCQCPHVVIYKAPKLGEWEYKLRSGKKIKWISLPNIILERQLLPELILQQATPENIVKELITLLRDTPERNFQLDGFEELSQLLGSDSCFDQTLDLIKTLI